MKTFVLADWIALESMKFYCFCQISYVAYRNNFLITEKNDCTKGKQVNCFEKIKIDYFNYP